MHYIVISPCILQTVEITTSPFNSKCQLRPMKTIARNGPEWPLVSPQIVKMTPEIYTRNTLSKNSKKLPKMGKNSQKWLFLVQNGQNYFFKCPPKFPTFLATFIS